MPICSNSDRQHCALSRRHYPDDKHTINYIQCIYLKMSQHIFLLTVECLNVFYNNHSNHNRWLFRFSLTSHHLRLFLSEIRELLSQCFKPYYFLFVCQFIFRTLFLNIQNGTAFNRIICTLILILAYEFGHVYTKNTHYCSHFWLPYSQYIQHMWYVYQEKKSMAFLRVQLRFSISMI